MTGPDTPSGGIWGTDDVIAEDTGDRWGTRETENPRQAEAQPGFSRVTLREPYLINSIFRADRKSPARIS